MELFRHLSTSTGFPEDGPIDGKLLCLLHYESKLASSAVGALARLIFLIGVRTLDKYRFNVQTPDIMIAANHNILTFEHRVEASIFLLLCVSPIDPRALPGVKQWPPSAPPTGSRSAIQTTTMEISGRSAQPEGRVTLRVPWIGSSVLSFAARRNVKQSMEVAQVLNKVREVHHSPSWLRSLQNFEEKHRVRGSIGRHLSHFPPIAMPSSSSKSIRNFGGLKSP